MNDELIAAWDELDRAIGAILVSQPSRITKAAENLELANQKYRALFMKAAGAALLAASHKTIQQ